MSVRTAGARSDVAAPQLAPRSDGAVHIALRGIAQTYIARAGHGAVEALAPIDFDFRQGEFVSVVGPSGCGKTTLLEIVAGLVKPTQGSVEINGEVVTGTVAGGIGVVFQEDASFPWLNVWDNVAFGVRRAGLDAGETKRRVEHALAFMGLSAFKSAFPSQLSGGMRQRVCIARTMVLRPQIILLDEPFGALDQQTRLLMGEELLRLWRATGATVMLITHALDEAALLSDRVAVMSARPGRLIDVVATGWPRERDSALVTDPKFGSLTAQLWTTLREESRKALGTI